MKITLLILSIVALLLPMAACDVARPSDVPQLLTNVMPELPPCDICGQVPRPELDGGTTHGMSYFEVFAEHGGGWLQIFVENCRPSTASPVHRLHFTAQYNLEELYERLQHAEPNEPFTAIFDGITIALSSEISGLEQLQIGLSEWQPPTGFAYSIQRIRF
ncbi:MAG: hypothetical protein FWB76_03235 [Oscillospiraceae bacterium]|nr:hypothetical protein [Oscillospiraceae bacterium]